MKIQQIRNAPFALSSAGKHFDRPLVSKELVGTSMSAPSPRSGEGENSIPYN